MGSGTIIIIVAASLAVVIFTVLVWTALFFSSSVIHPPKRSLEFALRYHIEKQGLPENFYKDLNRTPWQFTSHRGYKLFGEMISPASPAREVQNLQAEFKLLIAVHGHGHNRMGMLKYLPLFLERGFSVLIYDQVFSGVSEGKYSTLGYFEAKDLRDIIDSVFEKYGRPAELGLLGESMGAATVLVEASTDNRPDFLIADCPFADLEEQLIYRLSFAYRLPGFPLIQLGSMIARLRAGFAWRDVSPLESIQDANGIPDIPVLFVHGEDDTYIPSQSSHRLHKAKRGYKDLVIVPGARHTESIVIDRHSYEAAIIRLLTQSRPDRIRTD